MRSLIGTVKHARYAVGSLSACGTRPVRAGRRCLRPHLQLGHPTHQPAGRPVRRPPLDASVGYRLDGLDVNLGVGDLFVFSLFAPAASKEHGRRGTVTAAAAITLFGALTPILLPAALAFGDTDGGSSSPPRRSSAPPPP